MNKSITTINQEIARVNSAAKEKHTQFTDDNNNANSIEASAFVGNLKPTNCDQGAAPF
jgi:hypothetical protein